MDATTGSWLDGELAGCAFADERLGRRLRRLLERMAGAMGESLPLACQDWANTKAAYRFLSNERVSEARILAGPFRSARQRCAATGGIILVVQDTTEFSFQRERAERVGSTSRVTSGKDKAGRSRMHTACGLLMHANLAVTTEGLPSGLSAVRFWSRQRFKGAAALKRRVNPTRVPIEHKESIRWLENMRQSAQLLGEPERCAPIGDREGDIYELFCAAQELGTHFLVGSCVDRLAGNGDHTIADEMNGVPVQGVHPVEVRDGKGRVDTAAVELGYRSVRVLPPVGKQQRYPALTLTVVHAEEQAEPADRPAIDWRLITDSPASSRGAAVEQLRWYAMRWKIEVSHKILRSGCRAEEARLRTAERLVKLIAVFCILSWRVLWMTMIARSAPHATPRLALTDVEVTLLDRLVPDRVRPAPSEKTLSVYPIKGARLGGYPARAKDPPPGNAVMWRGLSRLTGIVLGATLAAPTPTRG